MKIKIVALMAIAAIEILVRMKTYVIIIPCKADNGNIDYNNSIINIY